MFNNEFDGYDTSDYWPCEKFIVTFYPCLIVHNGSIFSEDPDALHGQWSRKKSLPLDVNVRG